MGTIQIKINEESCIRCGACVKVCPSYIFLQKHAKDAVLLNQESRCLGCGHCVDVCPTDSITHSLFSKEHIHAIDYSSMPSPEQMLALIRSRRSCRSLNSKAIPETVIEHLISAGKYAPTATNSRRVEFTVIANSDEIASLTGMIMSKLESVSKKAKNPIYRATLKAFVGNLSKYLSFLDELQGVYANGKDPIFYKAPLVIIIHTPNSNKWGSTDANLAYQNISLMAQSYGISQIYMGIFMKMLKFGLNKPITQKYGIQGNIQAVMALGYPLIQYRNYTDRE